MILKGLWAGQPLVITGVYAPHNSQAGFWSEINDLLIDINTPNILLLDDFNGPFDNDIDCSRHSEGAELPKSFKDLSEYFQLIDIWQRDNPAKRDYTFFFSPI